jgi:hypothetical protein
LEAVAPDEDSEDAPTILKRSERPPRGSLPAVKARATNGAARPESAPPPPVRVNDAPSTTQTPSSTNGTMTLPSDGRSSAVEAGQASKPPQMQKRAVVVVLAGLAACVGFGTWFFSRTSHTPPPATQSVSRPSASAQIPDAPQALPLPAMTLSATSAEASVAPAPSDLVVPRLPAQERPTSPTDSPKDAGTKDARAKDARSKDASPKDAGHPKEPGDDLTNPYK